MPRLKTILEDVREGMIDMLIAAGTTGLKQNVIVKRFRQFHADEIRHELELLLAEDKVQKFHFEDKGNKKATIWRATDKIRDLTVIRPLVKKAKSS